MFYEERKEKALAALNKAKEEYETIRKKAGNKTESLYSLRKGCAIAIKNVEACLSLKNVEWINTISLRLVECFSQSLGLIE